MTPNRVIGRLRPPVALFVGVIIGTVTLYPALRKFFEYSSRVEQFWTHWMPYPEVAVPATGVTELVSIVLIGVGIADRLGAGTLSSEMIVTIVAAGPSPFGLLGLVGSVGIALIAGGNTRGE